MKKILIAAVTALSLGGGAAFAQGVPTGTATPVYGSQGFTDHSHDPEVHFLGAGTAVGRMLGHTDDDHAVAATTTSRGS